jgi:EAL domain-containing protein (putative c-di-GMP-specific phosphodiesterase class I)
VTIGERVSAPKGDLNTGLHRIARTDTPGDVEVSLEPAIDELLRLRRAPALVFQPIVDLQRGLTVGYEVLSRFPGPPVATPDKWFQAAYQTGRGVELEALVIEHALASRVHLPPNCFLSLNVAPEALLEPVVQSLLRAQPLSRLVLELTEHSAVADYDLLAHVIDDARALGAFVAVDDAGAGYASLQHILALRPDFVKLDRALIAGLHLDEAKAALTEMFGGFTSRIDAWLLAEGIEERAELARLAQLGVPLGQGYLLGRPVPRMAELSEEVARVLREPDVARDDRTTVLSLTEPHDAAQASESDRVLQSLLRDPGALHYLPLLDSSTRPIALATRCGPEEIVRRAAMCVLGTTPVRDALERALTRLPHSRFDPLMCCDDLGHYCGVIRVERLMESVLAASR